MKKIDGIAKSVNDILKGNRYSIDYYQREYRWEFKQLQELVNDLTGRFSDAWDSAHERSEVEKYPYYFLGSIIVSEKDSASFIVDGQQRLTSLTLLLTYLRRLQDQRAVQVPIDDLLMVEKYGKKSFNLDVADRTECMTSLFETGRFSPPPEASESVQTLVARYDELDDTFPEELRGDALPFFIDWLIYRVQIVQITAYTDDDAYTIFETMNDRGLKLTPADMLKGYLLSNITEGTARATANDSWRKRMLELGSLHKDGDSDFIKTWFRSQYAEKIRERKKAARPEDWDRIGTEFHRWVRNDAVRLGLSSQGTFYDFVMKDMDFYSRQYLRVAKASTGESTPSGLEHIGYNADRGFTLQHQLLLAPLQPEDSQETVDQKLALVARYVDILLAWRIWNWRSIAYSTMSYAMFVVMKDIRGLSAEDLAVRLHSLLLSETETFDSNNRFRMHQQNRFQVHRFLARLTDYVAVQSGGASRYRELTNAANVRYEVEHIWADHPEQYLDEFPQTHDFSEHRNLIGGLLLLPKSFNASYNDDAYESKLQHYLTQNLLARSLHSQCYEKNPGFVQFIKKGNLPFKPYDSFTKTANLERGELYRDLAKRIWNPDDLLGLGASSGSGTTSGGASTDA
ncbi:DUF262 domain-containing protein [Arthrobacter sp. zg-Y820]|uniref:DUF262 domain-containing protein n=1 Tax=unclassified Arthrobacter TaxID=235627 RepID=UPI001E4E005D|nr:MULTISPECIES: DUF262 domain-containing protein [unclassified Arthrobacter]MCC9195299.1 DUF262 domain-containing protein [Arthrobacter sp. zg-Y820]MDK1278158.1 DUF262 domain-containing protein [Arthrobacter sp. zg.Y820]MDK1361364.1 DUF262 domain-containing protein [Arthrobacter sp. zg-Y1219]WIB10045.1 DUF262 domain-containing protein [Arthrobacter sp. zg-Y820]